MRRAYKLALIKKRKIFIFLSIIALLLSAHFAFWYYISNRTVNATKKYLTNVVGSGFVKEIKWRSLNKLTYPLGIGATFSDLAIDIGKKGSQVLTVILPEVGVSWSFNGLTLTIPNNFEIKISGMAEPYVIAANSNFLTRVKILNRKNGSARTTFRAKDISLLDVTNNARAIFYIKNAALNFTQEKSGEFDVGSVKASTQIKDFSQDAEDFISFNGNFSWQVPVNFSNDGCINDSECGLHKSKLVIDAFNVESSNFSMDASGTLSTDGVDPKAFVDIEVKIRPYFVIPKIVAKVFTNLVSQGEEVHDSTKIAAMSVNLENAISELLSEIKSAQVQTNTSSSNNYDSKLVDEEFLVLRFKREEEGELAINGKPLDKIIMRVVKSLL